MQQSWVEESLSKVSREGNLTLNSAENTLKSWIYFLEYGSLPWWYSVNQAKENFTWKRISTLLNNPLDKEGLLKRFQHSSFFERVLRQYSNEDISQLIWMLIEKNALIDKSQYGQILEKLDNELKISFFRLILGLSLKKILNDREYIVFQVYYSKVITSKREIVEKIFREVIKFDDIKGRKK